MTHLSIKPKRSLDPTILQEKRIHLGSRSSGNIGKAYHDSVAVFASDDASDGVLILHFDEGSGNIAYDDSGNGNNGLIYDTNWEPNGISGSALKFNGTKGYIEVPDAASLKPQQLTISVWVKPSVEQGTIDYLQPIITRTNSDAWFSADGYDFFYNNEVISLALAYHSSWRRGGGVDATIPASVWSNLVATYDQNEIKFYLNGQYIGSSAYSYPIYYGTGNIWIGRWYQRFGSHSGDILYKGNYHFSGIIDEVSIFNRALSAEEVQTRYQDFAHQSPVAKFVFLPEEPIVGESITFNGSGSSDPDDFIVSYTWDFGDGSTGSGITCSHSYSSNGKQYVTLTVIDGDGLTDSETIEVVVTSIDTIPPVSSSQQIGSIGLKGWYHSEVNTELFATDNEGGSGVKKTECSYDGTNWNTYSIPFTLPNEGITTIYYRSTDNAGNIEETKQETIKIDKTPPELAMPPPIFVTVHQCTGCYGYLQLYCHRFHQRYCILVMYS